MGAGGKIAGVSRVTSAAFGGGFVIRGKGWSQRGGDNRIAQFLVDGHCRAMGVVSGTTCRSPS